MRHSFLFILLFALCNAVKAQHSSAVAIKLKTDSVRNFIYTGPSSELLPAEFNAAALANEYYCDSSYSNNHIFTLTLRDNCTFFCETFYKPYNWARIEYRIGSYHISGDTIYLTYKQLLPGKKGDIYVSPTLSVSWIPPRPPQYLLLNKTRLFDPPLQRSFYTLTGKSQFDLGSCK
jgi:hypothetical protein